MALVIRWKKFVNAKKGQLFIIEAFIAVTVMILMVTAIYKVQIATEPPKEQNYDELAYNLLAQMDNTGSLEALVLSIKTGNAIEINSIKSQIEYTIYSAIPANAEFSMYCENITSSTILAQANINLNLNPTGNVFGVDYLIVEVGDVIEPYMFHLSIWLKGV